MSSESLDKIVAASVPVRGYTRGGITVRGYTRGNGISQMLGGGSSGGGGSSPSIRRPAPRASAPSASRGGGGSAMSVFQHIQKLLAIARGNPSALISAGKVRRVAAKNPGKNKQGHLLELHNHLSELHRHTGHATVKRLRDEVGAELHKTSSKGRRASG